MALDNMPCGKREQMAERRAKVWELRKSGKSHRDIAKELGVSHGIVGKDLDRTMNEMINREIENAEQWRAMECARLDKDYNDLCEREKGTLAGWEVYRIKELKIRIGESRRRLLGLDAGSGGASAAPVSAIQIVLEAARPPARQIIP